MTSQNLPAYNVQIWVGLKEMDTFRTHTVSDVEAVCQEYCDSIGLCVSVTPTRFVYTNGSEPGAVVGLIAYPRFPPKNSVQIKYQAIDLAKLLMERCGQMRVTVTTPTISIMLTNDKKVKE